MAAPQIRWWPGRDPEKWRAAEAESPGAAGAAVLRRAAVLSERAAAAVPVAVARQGLRPAALGHRT